MTVASGLSVAMFHTLPCEARTSSEVYAGELGKALRAKGVDVLDVWPRSGQPARTAGALGRYWDRYLRYQAKASTAGSSVNHIPDHGYGHLAFSLDPRRTVVTFLDAMLLKLRARELPPRRPPWVTMTGHRLSLRAIRRVAMVITPSESSRRDFLRFQDYPPERVVTVPLAVSPAFIPLPAPELSRSREAVILHVGHCGFYKNIDTILRALPLIARQLGRPVRFRKVGGRFTVAQEELIGALGLADSIDHLGMLPDRSLTRAYAGADLLLMPSLHEGFGLPVLEAMASGTPVVASNRGSLPEVVGDAGLQVEPEDEGALAEAVTRVLADAGLRRDLVRRGLERARQFSWERTATATMDVYRAIHEGAGS